MPTLAPILVILLAGLCLAAQAPTNAALARGTGSILSAALVSFGVGTALLFAGWIATSRAAFPGTTRIEPWMLAGGAFGAIYVVALTCATPRMGVANTLSLVLASQLIGALLIDRFGLFDVAPISISPARLGGVACIVLGALLIRR